MRPLRKHLVGLLLAGGVLQNAAVLGDGVEPPGPIPAEPAPDQGQPEGPASASPAPVEPATPAAPITSLKWQDVCKLSIDDGHLSFDTGLSPQMFREAGSEIPLTGLPGETTLSLNSRFFEITNVRKEGEDDLTLHIFGSRGSLEILMERVSKGKESSIDFQQGNPNYRRGGASFDARLECSGVKDGGNVGVFAKDLASLRRESPHEINRYLRPVLQMLGQDLFAIDPAEARQVLLSDDSDLRYLDTVRPPASTEKPSDDVQISEAGVAKKLAGGPAVTIQAASSQPDVSPELIAKVREILPRLEDASPKRRESASQQLERLGPGVARAVGAMDRTAFSPQQNTVLDCAITKLLKLPAAEVRDKQFNVHYLLDCLYCNDEQIRSLAVKRLTTISHKPPEHFAAAVKPGSTEKDRTEEIERLRDELGPKKG